MMQQDSPAGDGQAKTDAPGGAIPRFIHSKKRIKDADEQVLWNSWTIVANADPDSTVTVVYLHNDA